MDVLVLCTGNICRSPMAEAVLADLLEARGVDARVHSAGLVFDGRPAEPHAVAVMAEHGLDLSDHRARLLSAELLSGADLVLGMERRHVREAAMLLPDAWPRAFTVNELVRRGEALGPRTDADLRTWIGAAADGRTHADHLGEVPADVIDDPMGRSRRVFRHCAEEIIDRSRRIVDLIAPAPQSPLPDPD